MWPGPGQVTCGFSAVPTSTSPQETVRSMHNMKHSQPQPSRVLIVAVHLGVMALAFLLVAGTRIRTSDVRGTPRDEWARIGACFVGVSSDTNCSSESIATDLKALHGKVPPAARELLYLVWQLRQMEKDASALKRAERSCRTLGFDACDEVSLHAMRKMLTP